MYLLSFNFFVISSNFSSSISCFVDNSYILILPFNKLSSNAISYGLLIIGVPDKHNNLHFLASINKEYILSAILLPLITREIKL